MIQFSNARLSDLFGALNYTFKVQSACPVNNGEKVDFPALIFWPFSTLKILIG
jgi:hypothetical protein